jgi:hypothetical protein
MERQTSSRGAVESLLRDGEARTDAEIARATGLPHNKASGARSTLWEAGLVEPVEERDAAGRMRWRACPSERREEAQRAFRDNTERRTRSRLAQKSPGERANIVVYLLTDDEVNAAVLAQLDRSKFWRRARARAKDVRNDIQAERRARKNDLRRAMKESDANVEFLRTRSQLRDLVDVLFVASRTLEAERDRQDRRERTRIPESAWPELARNVREVLEVGQALFRDIAGLLGQPMESCPLCGERLHSVAAHLGEGVIDAEAVEDETLENVSAAD